MDKLYNEEQIKEWASKRADDAGRLSRQLLDTMRENERLREALAMAWDYLKDDPLKNAVLDIENMNMTLGKFVEQALSNKDSDNA